MIFDCSKPILNPKGEPQLLPEEMRNMTFLDIFLIVTNSNLPGDEGLKELDKLARYRLKQKIAATVSTVDLTDTEKKLLKDCCCKALSVDSFGQVYDFLDGVTVAPA